MIADIKPRYASVIEIISHEGAILRQLPNSSAIVTSREADIFYCAYYTADVVANEWDPCDQSVAAAYMPLRYSFLNVWPLENGGTFLVQRRRFHDCIWRNIVGDDYATRLVTLDRANPARIAEAIESLLHEAGVPSDEVGRCTAAVCDRLLAAN
jgi:hypothetical protein